MLDPQVCYQALLSRDARFDGRFFTGVKTTGVYCRPICPSRTPKLSNCKFFTLAAAAIQDGFRPCKRCLPEAAPGRSSWAGTSETVARALELIEKQNEPDLRPASVAQMLGVTDRHLRRLFEEHIGTSPAAVIRSRRLGFAVNLLRQTNLRVSDVAFASGFGSVRRFNEAISLAYGTTPLGLRGMPPSHRPELVVFSLAYRPPYDWGSMFGFRSTRQLGGVELCDPGSFSRVVTTSQGAGAIRVQPMKDRAAVRVELRSIPPADLMAATSAIRRMFDLDSDPDSIEETLITDRALRPLVRRRPGLRIPGSFDPFETLVRAVIGQRISVKAATTITRRIALELGKPVAGLEDWGLTHAFPSPDDLAEAPLEAFGLPASRASTLRSIAQLSTDGLLDLRPSADPEAVVERLSRIPGVGPWTISYFLLRSGGDPDAFPLTDLGIVSGAEAIGIDRRSLPARSEAWRPWRSYAAMHLWNSSSDKEGTWNL